MKIVIAGYGPAAVSALKAISSSSSVGKPEVTLVTPERHPAYSPMFLIEYAFGQLNKRQLNLPLSVKNGLRLTPITGRKVIAVHAADHKVRLDNGKSLSYDCLLIATGASAVRPPIKGLEKTGVFYINRLVDVVHLRERVKRASQAIIVGAGAIGIETALALARRGQRVTIIEAMDQILPLLLDRDLAGFVQNRLEAGGISFCLGSHVSEITGKRRAAGVIAGGKAIPGDLVIVAAGFKPNIEMVDRTGIKTGKGILVDELMQTSVPGVYAAGDVAEARNPFLDRSETNFTWYNAIEQGQVAGYNMVGMDKRCDYSPSLNVLKGLDFTVASVGQKVRTEDYEVVSFRDEGTGILEKIYVKGDYIEHYQSVGLPYKLGYIYNAIKNRKNISPFKSRLPGAEGIATFLV